MAPDRSATTEHVHLRGELETDHLLICWTPDHEATCYPDTVDPVRLAGRLVRLVALLSEYPGLIAHAAGACEGGDE